MTSSQNKKETKKIPNQPSDNIPQINHHKTAKIGLLFLAFTIILLGWLYFALNQKPQKPIIPQSTQKEKLLKTIEPHFPVKTETVSSIDKISDSFTPQKATLSKTSLPTIETQENKTYIASLQKEVKELKEQIQNLSHRNIEEKKYADSLLALYDAIQNGRPFKKEIARVLSINSTDSLALSVEEKTGVWAATGIPTMTELKLIFKKEVRQIEQSFYIHPQMNWQDEIIAFFKSAVRVRPLQITQKNLKGISILYAIEEELNADHLEKAISRRNKLPSTQKMLFSTFIKQAEMRLQIDLLFQQYIHNSGE